MESQVSLVQKEAMDLMVQRVALALPGVLALTELKENREKLVHPVRLVFLETKARLDYLARMASTVP